MITPVDCSPSITTQIHCHLAGCFTSSLVVITVTNIVMAEKERIHTPLGMASSPTRFRWSLARAKHRQVLSFAAKVKRSKAKTPRRLRQRLARDLVGRSSHRRRYRLAHKGASVTAERIDVVVGDENFRPVGITTGGDGAIISPIGSINHTRCIKKGVSGN